MKIVDFLVSQFPFKAELVQINGFRIPQMFASLLVTLRDENMPCAALITPQ